MNLDEKTFHQTIMEIGYLGAFYGMADQARAIFSFYLTESQSPAAKTAAILGETLLLIGRQEYQQAINLLEAFLEDHQDAPIEIKVFLAFAYKRAKLRADRVKALLGDMEGNIAGPAAEIVRGIAAS